MVEKYLIKFEPVTGATHSLRGTTYPIDCTMTDDRISELVTAGYTIVDNDDYQYYIGNRGRGDNGQGYVRDNATGKPISAPAYIATPSEQANSLATAYTATVKDINSNIVLAMADGDKDTVAELKEDKAAALAEYKTKLEAVNNG